MVPTDLSRLDRAAPAALRAALAEHPTLRARDLADRLAVPEAALLAARTGRGVVRIAAQPDRLIPAVQDLGEVMALTRNEHVVHERIGSYLDYQSGGHAAMVLGTEIDLRIFPTHWVHAFAVTSEKPSLQVFDAAGDAVHKVHLRAASDRDAFDRKVATLALPDQTDDLPDFAPRSTPEPARTHPDRGEELRTRWARLTDTHQFLGLVRKL